MKTVLVTSFLLMSEDEVNLVELYKNEEYESQQQQPIQEQPQELTEEQMLRAPCGTFTVTRPPKIYLDGKFYDQQQIINLLQKARDEVDQQKQTISGLQASVTHINQQLNRATAQLNRAQQQLHASEINNSALQDLIDLLDEELQQK